MPETALRLQSTAFENDAPIPTKYTCDGEDASPELNWGPVPVEARSFALIVDDPDAPNGTFTHWVLFDIPASAEGLPENAEVEGIAGMNDFGKVGYGGPCPPSGDLAHRYFFTLNALDIESLGLGKGASRADVENTMNDHIVATTQLVGTYQRA